MVLQALAEPLPWRMTTLRVEVSSRCHGGAIWPLLYAASWFWPALMCVKPCSEEGQAPGQALHKRQRAGKLLCSPIIACGGVTRRLLWSCPACLVSTTGLCSLAAGLEPFMKLQTADSQATTCPA